jgi:hypothetical protein
MTEPNDRQLCMLAPIGLLWSAAFVLVAISAFFILIPVPEEGAVVSVGQSLLQGLAWLSLGGALGGPWLSALAATRIRDSEGQLFGLGAALLGLWLIPLVMVDGLLFSLFAWLISNVTADRDLIYILYMLSSVLLLVFSVMVMRWILRRAEHLDVTG